MQSSTNIFCGGNKHPALLSAAAFCQAKNLCMLLAFAKVKMKY
jgi:hypothetical protein